MALAMVGGTRHAGLAGGVLVMQAIALVGAAPLVASAATTSVLRHGLILGFGMGALGWGIGGVMGSMGTSPELVNGAPFLGFSAFVISPFTGWLGALLRKVIAEGK